MKYFLVHHGQLHTFDEYEEVEHKFAKNSDWIYYTFDGSRYGAYRSLLSETFKDACDKFIEHCLARAQINSRGLKVTLRRAAEEVDNIETWTTTLLRFQQTLMKGE